MCARASAGQAARAAPNAPVASASFRRLTLPFLPLTIRLPQGAVKVTARLGQCAGSTRVNAIRARQVGADCGDPPITLRALPLLTGGRYPAAPKRLATSGQFTTFHQASM